MSPTNSHNDTDNNWLSFSLSPMEFLANNSHLPTPPQPYFIHPFYSNDWGSEPKVSHQSMQMYTEHTSTNTIPKLEDFFGGHNTTSYNNNNNNTESPTQDSSSQLTHFYEPHQHSNYFDLQSMPSSTGFQTAFSTNSGSEVDDSGSVSANTQLACAEYVSQAIEPELVHGFNTVTTSTTATTNTAVNNGGSLSLAVVPKDKSGDGVVVADNSATKKVAQNFGQRTSIYRGVTRHRWTGRYEAHLWDNTCRREGQARKGRQVYLGGYDKEEKAARAYDMAALKYWGPTATINFPLSDYTKELEDMNLSTKQEFIAAIRRKSSGFSRGASIYRGVTRHHQQGRWQARIGRVAGNKDLYLGTFGTEEEAAEAYDIAAIKFRGLSAVTNFEMNRYNVDAILNSNLPVGGAAKRLKLATEAIEQTPPTLSLDQHSYMSYASNGNSSGTINFSDIQPVPQASAAVPFDTSAAYFHHQNLLQHLSSNGVGQQLTLDSLGSNLSSQTSGELYIWPHQSY